MIAGADARADCEATPPPMAPPDMVMVRITNGNTSAIAASHSTRAAQIAGLGDDDERRR